LLDPLHKSATRVAGCPPRTRLPARLEPVADPLFDEARFRAMARQHFGLHSVPPVAAAIKKGNWMTETEKETLWPTGRLVLEIPMKLWHQRCGAAPRKPSSYFGAGETSHS